MANVLGELFGDIANAIREKTVGTIKLIICGGAHMSREIMEEFMYMGVTVLQGPQNPACWLHYG